MPAQKINKFFFDCIVFNSYFLEEADAEFWVLSADGYLIDEVLADPKRFEICPQTLDSSFTSEEVAEHLKQEADYWFDRSTCNRYVVLHEGNEIACRRTSDE